MTEFIKSNDGEMQYSQEELEMLRQQGITSGQRKEDPTRVLSLSQKLAEKARAVTGYWGKQRRKDIAFQDPDIRFATPEEEGYVSFWNFIHQKIREIVSDLDKDSCMQRIFDFVMYINDEDLLGNVPTIQPQINPMGTDEMEKILNLLKNADIEALKKWENEYYLAKFTPNKTEIPYYQFREEFRLNDENN